MQDDIFYTVTGDQISSGMVTSIMGKHIQRPRKTIKQLVRMSCIPVLVLQISFIQTWMMK